MLNKNFLFLLISLIFLSTTVSAGCIIPFLCDTDLIIIDRSPDINATYGEMTTFLDGSRFPNPFDSNVIDGNIISGSFFDLFVTDGNALVVSETGMFKIDMNFNGLTNPPQRIDMFANYDGSPSHRIKIMLFDFDTNTYVDLTSAMTDFPDDPTGEFTRFTFDANSTMGNFMDDSGKAGVRIELTMGTPNPDHTFSIDAIALIDGKINFVTLGTFEKVFDVTEGVSRNVDVNAELGTFTILEGGKYQTDLSLNYSTPLDTAYIMAIFVNDVRINKTFTSNTSDDNIETILVNPISAILDLNAGDVVQFRIASEPGSFIVFIGYNFSIVKLTGFTSADLQDIFQTFTGDTGSATADSPTDTFNFVGGSGIDANISGKTLTITATGDFVLSNIFNSAFSLDFNINNVTRLLQDSNCDNNVNCTFTGDFNVLVPAFMVTSDGNGTFGAGNYVFPGDLNLSTGNLIVGGTIIGILTDPDIIDLRNNAMALNGGLEIESSAGISGPTGANFNINSQGNIRVRIDSDESSTNQFSVVDGSLNNILVVSEAQLVTLPNNGDFNAFQLCLSDDCIDAWADVNVGISEADANDLYVKLNPTAAQLISGFDLNLARNLFIADDQSIIFGDDSNWSLKFDQAVDNQLLWTTNDTSTGNINDPFFEILVGTTPTANQQIFGIAKGTQASNISLLDCDEDGDCFFNGSIATGSFRGGSTGTGFLNQTQTFITHRSAAAIGNGTRLWTFTFRGTESAGGATSETGAEIRVDGDGTWSSNVSPGRIVFLTTPIGTDSVVERMRINNAGLVDIAQGLVVGGEATFNEDGGDNDFRVETDNRVNGFFINGGNDTASFDVNVTVGDLFTITPRPIAPVTCSIGDFYVDTSGGYCGCSVTDTWENLGTTGSCV